MPEITPVTTNALEEHSSSEGKPHLDSSDETFNEKTKEGITGVKELGLHSKETGLTTDSGHESDNSDDVIIISGADAAAHLLPLRDDGDSALTFRGLFLASCLSCFQAVMYQIYTVSGQTSELILPILRTMLIDIFIV